MTDYFSRLLQQTGIETMPDPEAEETIDQIMMEDLSPKSREDDGTTPLEVDEQVMIEPPAKSIPAKSDGRVLTSKVASSAPELSGRDSRLEVEEWKGQGPEISGSRDSGSKKDEESGSRQPEQEESLQSRPIAKKTLTGTPNIETEIIKAERVQTHLHSSVPLNGASVKTVSSSKGIRGNKKISREQVLHTVYKEVRNWAAAQSALTTEEHQSQVAAGVVNQVRQTLPRVMGLDQGPGKDAIIQHLQQEPRIGKPDETGIATQHFHLSIGPISVLVEEPRRDIRSRRPSPRGEARSMTDRRSSRLSRHYVHL